MTPQETLSALVILASAYQDKSDVRQTATIWHTMLKDYPYSIVEKAIYEFIRDDRREYTGMPTVGQIIGKSEEVRKRYGKLVNEAYFERDWSDVEKSLQELTNETEYDRLKSHDRDWLQEHRTEIIGYLIAHQQSVYPYLPQKATSNERKLIK